MTDLDAIVLRPVTFEIAMMLLLLLVLLFCSALVSGSEVAYFSLKPVEIEKLRERNTSKDRLIVKHLEDPERLLAAILISNNFVNVAIVMLSAFVSGALIDFGEASVIKFIFETIIITALILFFGEVMPKIYSRQNTEGFARFMAYPLNVMKIVFAPFIRILMASTSLVGKRLSRHQQNMSIDDLSQALELTEEDIKEEKEMLEGIVKFSCLDVKDIMTPRLDVVCVDTSDDYESMMERVISSGYSRIPVYEERADNIKGVLYVKDLLPYVGRGVDVDWRSLLRQAYFVPETKPIADLLEEFQTCKNHMAIVVDEYGGMQGIVTLEDILEEIVGDISDELDEEERQWTRQKDGSIVFEAKISLNDFFKVTGVDENLFEAERGEAETLAGFLLEVNGLIPRKYDIIKYKGYKFEIVAADVRKIKLVKFSEL